MKVFRTILAVIIGYLIFALSAVLLFTLANIEPHDETGYTTIVGVIAYGIVFSLIGGTITKLIASGTSLTANIILALLIAAIAAVSAYMSDGSNYTQFAAIAIFAPASLIGGIITSRTK